MANETATKSKRFYCVSLLPDICKTPIGPSTPPIPYSIVGEFSDATNVSPNVKAHSELVILHQRSVIPTVKGDEPGKAGGIKSGTFGKKVETKTASKTYFANGTATVQEGCEVWMNNRNTVGKIYERGGAAPRSRLEQIAAMAQQEIDETAKEVRAALRPVAQSYKDTLSETVHNFAAGAIDKGGKVVATGVVLTGSGVAATATVVGAPVGAPTAAAGTIATAAGGAVTTVGAVVETGATLLDNLADYILTNKTPDLKAMAMGVGQRLLTSLVGSKIPGLSSLVQKGKQGKKAAAPRPSQPRPPDKAKGGKVKKKKEKKSDKPSECCPKNKAPGGKPVSSRHPVHFGTGEEVLYQTDFVIDGAVPLPWTRCYRSGSELEDWGMCGARWGMPYTASIITTGKGIVYIDDSGRPLLLPSIEKGAVLDNRKEGFTLTRSRDTEYVLAWRDGSTDKFVRCPSADSWIPHGFDGVNAMDPASEPLLAERYTVCRSQGRDGRGITIERFPDAETGQVLLRVRSDEGQMLEAMRDHGREAVASEARSSRIGRVDEVREDGSRVCQVRYEYETEPVVSPHDDSPFAPPPRYNLLKQTDLAGHTRSYGYRNHLLTSYTTYSGFEHTLQWLSLAALRERWSGNQALADAKLLERYPITLDNSYQARAIATETADGLDSVRIDYLNEDTTRVTDANGGVLEYEFDANWLAVDVRRIDANGTANSLGRRVWDKDGMLLEEIDTAGRATRFAYDAAGNLTVSTDALGRSSRIEYDGHNQPVAITDPLGHVTRLEYNNCGNVISQTDALGHFTSYRHDDQGRLAALTDAKGGTKQVAYDKAGRLASYTDCSGYCTSFEYDQSGRLTSVTDALNQVTQYAYDLVGNMTKTIQADGATEQFEHDTEGRLTVHTDAAGYKTQYRYNGHGLPLERIDALGYTVQYRYDALLQLVELINANGESYHFTYDVEGRLTSEVGFDGKTTNYSYDSSGQLIATECAGNRIELLRDVLGQLIAKQTADGVYRFAYDPLGRMTVAIAPHARNDFAYDALGQVIDERSAYFLTPPQLDMVGPPNPDARFVMTHAYDELGNRIRTILPNGRQIDILRYGSGHWHGTLWEGQTVVDIERDRLHREKLRRIGFEGRTTATRDYDAVSRITRMILRRAHDNVELSLRYREFRYDLTGNLLEMRRGWHEINTPLETLTYEYDSLGQLTSAIQAGLTERFSFDPAGNGFNSSAIDSEIRADPGPIMPAPRKHIGANLARAINAHVYTYDTRGNVSNKRCRSSQENDFGKELSLTYDAEDRLVLAVMTDAETCTTARYFYDAFGRRSAKITSAGNKYDTNEGNERWTLFLWDGDVLLQDLYGDVSVSYLYEADSFIPLARIETARRQTEKYSHKLDCEGHLEVHSSNNQNKQDALSDQPRHPAVVK